MKFKRCLGNTLLERRKDTMKSGPGIAALVLSLFLLVGCGYSRPATVDTLEVQFEPTATATPYPMPVEAHGDCGWESDVLTFIDENANKRWDASEPPLPGVKIYATDILDNEIVGGGKTDEKGRTLLTVFMSGCKDIEFEIYAGVPEGYMPTTAERIAEDEVRPGGPVMFGFRHAGSSPASTVVPGMPRTGSPNDSLSPQSQQR